MKEKGLIHVNCGDGQGKTTAALGLAIRFAGRGGKVLYYQFLKDGSSGEISMIKNLEGITYLEGYALSKFTFLMTQEEKEAARAYYTKHFSNLVEEAKKSYQLLVLDEVLDAVNEDLLPLKDLITFLNNKPEDLEVVLTGRNPKEEILSLADYVTEMKKCKHPFDQGLAAREGIEY